MTNQLRSFLVGLALGGVFMLVACWTSPAVALQRVGMALMMLGATALLIWVAAFIADYGVRTAGVYRELVAFMWQRARAKKEASDD